MTAWMSGYPWRVNSHVWGKGLNGNQESRDRASQLASGPLPRTSDACCSQKMKGHGNVANMSDGCGASRSSNRRNAQAVGALTPKQVRGTTWIRTAVLCNRLGYAARIAFPYFLPAGFAKIYDFKTFEVVVAEARILGCSQCGLKERLCFVPRHCLVTFGMHQNQLEP